MDNKEVVFADGFIAKRKDNAKDFLIVNLALKVDEAVAFIEKNAKGDWINLEVKRARNGKLYVALDTFVPTKAEPVKAAAVEVEDELAF